MSIFDRIISIQKPQHTEERGVDLGGLFYGGVQNYSASQALRLSAVYCAVNQISNSCSVLPIHIIEKQDADSKILYTHPLTGLLNGKPDSLHNHMTFFKQMVESVLLRGAGYAMIERDSRLNVKKLTYLDYGNVQPMIQENGTVKYLVTGASRALDADEILDFHLHVDNTYRGESVIKHASLALEGAYSADKTSANFFKSGGNMAGVLKPSAPLNADQRNQAAQSWKQSFEMTSDRIPVVILPYGLDFQPISVTPDDAQLLESRKYSVEEIARFFNIPPYKLYYGMSNVDASNEIESMQSLYLLDTILPMTTMMAEEMEQKLFRNSDKGKYSVDFDFSALYKTNKQTEADYYRALLNIGVLSINEVRGKLNMEPIDGAAGTAHWVQLSYANAEDVANGVYVKQESQDQSGKLANDNKLK